MEPGSCRCLSTSLADRILSGDRVGALMWTHWTKGRDVVQASTLHVQRQTTSAEGEAVHSCTPKLQGAQAERDKTQL